MRRLFSLLTLLSVTAMLFACGGGGDSTPASSDTTAPTVTAFTIPANATTTAVPVTTFTATDAVGVTGYMITTSATAPAASATGWATTAPTTFTFPATGEQTAYAWAKDAAGNVSTSRSAAVTISGSGTILARPVQGALIDPSTSAPISNATVSAFLQLTSTIPKLVAATPVQTTYSDANGNFFMERLNAGTTYYFEIAKSGFAPFTYYNITPDAISNLSLENARVLPSSIANLTATASGKVKNASTNGDLSGMTVKIRVGVNNKTGSVVATQTTNATGDYSFANLAAGTYTAEVTGTISTTPIVTSYFTLVSVPNSTLNTNQDFAVTTGTSGTGQYRIVLSWGNNPSDLDSHLTGPSATTTRFHTAYSSPDYPAGTTTQQPQTTTGLYYRVAGATTEAFLDVDNTRHGTGTGTDNGPETTSILVPHTGAYKFYVHHWGGTSNISASGAQVKVYQGNALLASFNPPSGGVASGDVWAVFTMDVTTNGQTITPVNRIFVGAGTANLDGLTGGSSTTPTNKLTIGTGFNGFDITGAGTSFTLAATGGGTLYAKIESATAFGTKFARLYINNGTYGQKDYCSTCNSQPLLDGTNVKIGQFRITDTGTYALKAYAVGPLFDIGVETPLGTASVTITQ